MEHLRTELFGIRTGRAHPGLVEGVSVAAYDTQSPLKSLASVTVPDARTLQIEPWDASIVKNVEKALVDANLGMNPTVDGKILRLTMPQMTEENRKQMVRMVKEKAEDARVALRQVREEVRHAVQQLEKAKEVTEDERYKMFDEVDKMTKQYVERVDSMAGDKEKEVLTI